MPKNIFSLKPLKKLAVFLSIKHRILLIPSFGKQTRVLQISSFFLLLAGVLFLAVFGVSIFYFTNLGSIRNEIKELKKIDATYQPEMKKYQKIITKASDDFSQYTNEMNKVYQIFAGASASNIWNPSEIKTETKKYLQKLYDEYELPADFEVPSGIQTLSKMRVQSLLSVSHIKNINRFVQIRKQIINHIPTTWPIALGKGYKTSSFGVRFSPFSKKNAFHTGVDLAAEPKTPVLSAADGSVIFTGVRGYYGNTIIVQHKYGYQTLYGHNARNLVRMGQKVKKGQKIALLGNTGRSTGYHLHFEIKIEGIPIDPWPYLNVEI